ncbi:cyclophilin peptidyl-prolyl cis-trans isomerase Cyp8 [Microbotryomycetes sp. JL201]|nr:cyclophilin peptidyl-prolyl cis-trans isomerase Cyp8 [Microbotryomycetes sp. JL201]
MGHGSVCTANGTTYDLLSIIPYLRQHGKDPATGQALGAGDLITLNFARNNEGTYHDPVTFKVFNEHSHIVAIKTTGNVFSRDTVDRLNIKANHWHDLVSDEPFKRADIITLQDPLHLEARDLSKFDYVQRKIKFDPDGLPSSSSQTKAKETQKNSDATTTTKGPVKKLGAYVSNASSPYNLSVVSTGRAGASLTSTSAPIETKTENALWHEEDLMYEAVREKGEKGYARLVTNFGNLNLELHCDRAPRTCYNFLQLAKEGKYKDTIFHRLIPGFMIQGGDPTGTGRGGQSYWGKPFEDEFHQRTALKHNERGVLSMANSGPNTNGSQFFLTLRPTPHLDGKHTVFGRLVGGDDVLGKIERVPCDTATDRPLKEIHIRDVAVFGDPFDAYKQKLERKLSREAKERAKAEQRKRDSEVGTRDRTTWFGTSLATERPGAPSRGATIGKYLPATSSKREAVDEVGIDQAQKRSRQQGFGNFSNW